MFDGKPLADAELTFVPEQSNVDVTPGTGITDADGEYRARYLGKFGLSPGTYKVTLSKSTVAPDMGNIPPEMLDDPEQLRLSGATTQTLPDTYADLSKTAFTIEVAEGNGPYDFELDSKGR
ncbi:carboxypeptidase-like regulatory domain-containing protein [Tautonia sp. JC769]|uniref:carboxypeptidase-like regulatory domain-containing protein n=1 Tax=Tautonia sp. JC769 TaxID=3232135 RepID=UPI003458E504